MAVIINSTFEKLPENWTCSSCQRSKSEVVRVKDKKEIAKAVKHHDHIKEVTNDFFREKHGGSWVKKVPEGLGEFLNRIEHFTVCFSPTVICEDCNNAETSGRKKVEAPKFFSFAPSEIRQFVIPKSGKLHQIDEALLKKVYQIALQRFTIRLKMTRHLIQEAEQGRFWKTIP